MAEPNVPRKLPNILITGTPGCGKTTHATQLVELLQPSDPSWEHINVSEFVKEQDCHQGFNEEWQTWDVDEDKARQVLLGRWKIEEVAQQPGGKILDWHTCDMFPERWIDLVVVLRCDHTLLWNRLEKRGYALNKIEENNEAEIMQVVLDEARESYAEEIVVELTSDTAEQMEENVQRIFSWIEAWKKDHPNGAEQNE